MFPFLKRSAAPPFPLRRPSPLVRRAGFFGAALLLLWLVLHLMPRSSSVDPASLFSDASGTVAVDAPSARPRPVERSFFSPGNLAALVLLLGGGGLALYLRRRAGGAAGAAAFIHSIGHMQIAPGQQLRLVRCGGEVLLLGITSGQISLLKSYAEDALAPETPSSAPASAASFEDVMRRQMGASFTIQSDGVSC